MCQPSRPRGKASASTRRNRAGPPGAARPRTAGLRGRLTAGDRPELVLDPVQRPRRVDVAGQHQHRAVGPVMVLVERLQVLDADPRHVFGPAQDRVAIRVPQVGDGLVGLVEPGLGRLHLARPLLADHLPLGLDLVAGRTGPAHPVGLDLQGKLPAVGREGEPEVRAVLAGLGVGLPPGDERELVDLPLGESLGPLEQHVLEEVGQPRLSRRLVERTDRIKQVADHDRHALARQDQARRPLSRARSKTGRSPARGVEGGPCDVPPCPCRPSIS